MGKAEQVSPILLLLCPQTHKSVPKGMPHFKAPYPKRCWSNASPLQFMTQRGMIHQIGGLVQTQWFIRGHFPRF